MSGRRVIVEADGGSRGNPGPAGYGAVVFDADSHVVLAEAYESIGIETNNVAEYRGLIAGLEAARELGATAVAVRMDSKLIIEQMSGRWQVKHPSMRPLASLASALLGGFDEISLEWIPRERNAHADRLANRAMDIAAGKPVKDEKPAPSGLSWAPPDGVPTRLILVRHGRTAHSVGMLFSGRNDEPLDREGDRQADALARRLAQSGGIDAIVSSPLHRSMQTAERIGVALQRPVTTMDGLIETDFGAWEGRTEADIRAQWPSEFASWILTPNGAPPGGESFEQVARRVRRTRDELIRSHPGQTVAVVSHVTPIKTLIRIALEAPQSAMVRLRLDTASISEVSYYADGSASVRLFNDTSHLEIPAS